MLINEDRYLETYTNGTFAYTRVVRNITTTRNHKKLIFCEKKANLK